MRSVPRALRRPAYLRLANALGGPLANGPVRRRLRFEPEALMAAARRRTGLEDFGRGAFHDPLARLAAATETEANLNLVGRIAIHKYLVDLLANRLLLEHDRAADPGIATQRIERPLFITGLPRTGTTLLHNLIALDPGVRVPLTWEVMFPSPPPELRAEKSARRVVHAARQLRWVDRLAPEFKRIHAVGAELPQECIAITTHAFASIQFHTTHAVPSYQRWLDSADLLDAYRFHHAFLQQLQRHSPGQWVLKAPGHLFGMGTLFRVYPDARIVQTHRDPLKVVASIASHGTVLRAAFSDRVDPEEVGRSWSRRWAMGLERAMALRDAGAVTPDRYHDLHYDELVADPIAAVRRVYAHAELELSGQAEQAMSRFLERHPRNEHGSHRYSLEEFGLDADEEQERFAAYCRRFSITREVG